MRGRCLVRIRCTGTTSFLELFSLVGITPSSRWTPFLENRCGAVLFAHRNQQYSIDAYSNTSGSVVERIAYDQPTFTNAAGTVQSTSPNSINGFAVPGTVFTSDAKCGLAGAAHSRSPRPFLFLSTSSREYSRLPFASVLRGEGEIWILFHSIYSATRFALPGTVFLLMI